MNCIEDRNVVETNGEASVSKASCVIAGYYDDKYIRCFVAVTGKRNPIINLGYAIRVAVFRNLVASFVRNYPEGQIVSIGAGFDTLGFWALEHAPDITVFEIDYPSVVAAKSTVIDRNPAIFTPILGTNGGSRYRIHACDLRHTPHELVRVLMTAGFSTSRPSLFLAECTLIYLDPDVNDAITRSVFENGSDPNIPVFFASYDQVNPLDSFGRVMMSNLNARGCPLRSIQPNTGSQISRLREMGFSNVRVELMNHFTTRCKPKRPEIIDEVEELNLLQTHYIFSLASCRSSYDSKFFSEVFFET